MIDLKKDATQFLCCPVCHGELALETEMISGDEVVSGFLECNKCRIDYKIHDEIPDFVLPDLMNRTDEKWMRAYDGMARSYDLMMGIIIPFFSLGSEPFERRTWVNQLRAKPGDHVLDISTGTGRNLQLLAKKVGQNGRISAMDISNGALSYAKAKTRKGKPKNVDLQRANASYLPYKNNTFDAIIHVGGINTFGDKKKALEEMIRVAKPGGWMVIVDEGLAPSEQNSFVGKFLLKTNGLYACKPPTELLPKKVAGLQVRWKIIANRFLPIWPFYNMEFQKSAA